MRRYVQVIIIPFPIRDPQIVIAMGILERIPAVANAVPFNEYLILHKYYQLIIFIEPVTMLFYLI